MTVPPTDKTSMGDIYSTQITMRWSMGDVPKHLSQGHLAVMNYNILNYSPAAIQNHFRKWSMLCDLVGHLIGRVIGGPHGQVSDTKNPWLFFGLLTVQFRYNMAKVTQVIATTGQLSRQFWTTPRAIWRRWDPLESCQVNLAYYSRPIFYWEWKERVDWWAQ